MNLIKRAFGKLLHGFTQFLSFIMDILITVIEFFVTLVNSISRGILGFLGMGGCLLFFWFAGPFAFIVLFNPYIIVTILFLLIFPILGNKFISFLKYIKYTSTEFLFDQADYLVSGARKEFNTFSEYGNKYKRDEEAKRRKEQQQRQEQERREWESRFQQWYDYQNAQGNEYRRYNQYSGYGGSNTFSNPTTDFKSKYEKSCDTLGVPYNADKYQIKLAYRKKAKEYHPDMNKSPDATKIFQQINDSYEFLSESNIERYKKL